MWMLPVATANQHGARFKVTASKFSRQKLTHAYYVRREGHLYEVFLVLAKTRLILEQVLRAVLK